MELQNKDAQLWQFVKKQALVMFTYRQFSASGCVSNRNVRLSPVISTCGHSLCWWLFNHQWLVSTQPRRRKMNQVGKVHPFLARKLFPLLFLPQFGFVISVGISTASLSLPGGAGSEHPTLMMTETFAAALFTYIVTSWGGIMWRGMWRWTTDSQRKWRETYWTHLIDFGVRMWSASPSGSFVRVVCSTSHLPQRKCSLWAAAPNALLLLLLRLSSTCTTKFSNGS